MRSKTPLSEREAESNENDREQNWFEIDELTNGTGNLNNRCDNRCTVFRICASVCAVIILIITVAVCILVYRNTNPYNAADDAYIPGGLDSSYTVVRGSNGSVVFLGDSLVDMACGNFNLIGKLEHIYRYSFGYTNDGTGGYTIKKILDHLPPLLHNIRSVTNVHSNLNATSAIMNKNSSVFVILFWDSDCSDIWEVKMTYSEVQDLRDTYKRNVRTVVQSVLNTGAYMAMAGPEVLPWYHGKENMLDAYRQMNIDVAKEFRMQYIDVRSAFQAAISSGRSPTIYGDGEHPNNYGTEIIAKLFAKAIIDWKTK